MTGYGPFGEHKENPSWLVVKNLADTWHSDEHQLIVQEVPVSYNYVHKNIPLLLKQHQPQVVIHVGVGHPGRVALETRAYSTGYVRLDVDGHAGPCDGECVCLETSLDVDRVVIECRRCGPGEFGAVERSVDAGRYLCEYIFYTSLSETQAEGAHRNVLFVHVPDFTEEITLEKLTSVLRRVVECCCQQTPKQ